MEHVVPLTCMFIARKSIVDSKVKFITLVARLWVGLELKRLIVVVDFCFSM